MADSTAVKLPDLHHEVFCKKRPNEPAPRIEQYRQQDGDGQPRLVTRCQECAAIRYDPI